MLVNDGELGVLVEHVQLIDIEGDLDAATGANGVGRRDVRGHLAASTSP